MFAVAFAGPTALILHDQAQTSHITNYKGGLANHRKATPHEVANGRFAAAQFCVASF